MKAKKFLMVICSLSAIIFMQSMSLRMQNSPSLRQQLIGQWRNLGLRVDVKTANNTDKDVIWESNESNWEEKQKIKPIHTYFNNDNTFFSEYYDLKDSLIYRPTGKWTLLGNKLTFFYEKPKMDTLFFTIQIKNDIATFDGYLDWDDDGKKDDHYIGTQRKQKN